MSEQSESIRKPREYQMGYDRGYNEGYMAGISMYTDIVKHSIRPIHVFIKDIKNKELLRKIAKEYVEGDKE